MTGELFTAIVASATTGAICGVIIKHALDTRFFHEVRDIYEECIDAYVKRVEALQGEVKRYQVLLAQKATREAIKNTKLVTVKPKNTSEWIDFFYDLSTMPEGKIDIDLDFPNNKDDEEGK